MAAGVRLDGPATEMGVAPRRLGPRQPRRTRHRVSGYRTTPARIEGGRRLQAGSPAPYNEATGREVAIG